jgi:hypothetical protein
VPGSIAGLIVERDVDVVSLAASGFGAVEKYEPRDLVITVGAGMGLDQLRDVLAKEDQWLPLAEERGRGSVGGLVSSAAPVALEPLLGSVRRHVLACRTVALDGRCFRWGRAVVKNVAGYDVQGLWCGSRGRLGVLTSVALRVWARPQMDCNYTLTAPDGLRLLDELLRLPPADTFAPNAVRWTWSPGVPTGTMSIRLFGTEESVAARQARMESWAASLGTEVACRTEHPGSPAQVREPNAARPGPDRVELWASGLTAAALPMRSALETMRSSLGDRLIALEGYPLERAIRCDYTRPFGETPPAVPDIDALLTGLGDAPVGVDLGGPVEHAAVEARRFGVAHGLEERVLAALGGGKREWIADYL